MNNNLLYILIGTVVVAGLAAMGGVMVLLSMLIGAQAVLTISVWLLVVTVSVSVLWVIGFCVCASAEFRRNEAASKEYRKNTGYGE